LGVSGPHCGGRLLVWVIFAIVNKRINMKPSIWLFAWAFLAIGSPMVTRAQNYDLSWFTIDGGGGVSSGGAYSLSGTIGQPDAGHLSGNGFSIDGGFWGFFAPVQPESPPILTIARSNSFVVISWPQFAGAFRLQNNTNLASINGWVASSHSTSTNNGQISVTIPATTGKQFYRLINP
jgi:hypothetical protein